MKTAILWISLGAIVGAGAMAVYSKQRISPTELRTERAQAANSLLKHFEEETALETLPDVLLSSTNAGDRSMFVLVAAKADAKELEKLIYEAASKLQGKTRRFSLEILFARYAELDAQAALSLADDLRIDSSLRASVYGVWATNDTDGALSALQSMANSAASIDAGLAMIDAMGGDSLAFETVAAWMPEGTNLNRFQAKSIAALATTNGEAAFSQLQAMPKNAFRLDATNALARNWAQHDAQGALSAIGTIESYEERQAFQNELFKAWAKNDPDAVASFLIATRPSDNQEVNAFGHALRQLAIVQPNELLAIADSLDPKLQMQAKRSALANIAKQDAQQAVAAFESMPEAFKRNTRAISEMSRALGRSDPELAIQWALSLPDERKHRAGTILSALAKDDPDRALDMAFAVDNKRLRETLVSNVAANAIHSSDNPGQILERFAQEFSGRNDEYMQGQLFSAWAKRDLDSALDWMSTYEGELGRYSLSRLASDIVERDPQAAIAASERIREKDRSKWISSVAQSYAASDPQAALAWIESLRGQEVYETAIGAASQALVENNVELALSTATELQNDNAAAKIASAAIKKISENNPQRAVNWAINQSSERLRTQSLRIAMGQWAQDDLPAATQRARSLPNGKSKDSAISTVIHHSLWSGKGTFDEALLDEISNDFTRQQAAITAANFLNRKDKEAALSLLERRITDPAMLEAARQNVLSRTRY